MPKLCWTISCIACEKTVHFAHVCRTNPPQAKPMNTITQSPDTDDEYEHVKTLNKQSSNHPSTCLVEIEGKQVSMMIDTGASVNRIDEVTYSVLNQNRAKQQSKINHKIYSYGSTTPLPIWNDYNSNQSTVSSHDSPAHVVKGNTESLLSYATAKQLNLLAVLVKAVDEHKNIRFPQREFECLF